MTISSVSFFDAPQQDDSLLVRQIEPSSPSAAGLDRASGMVLVDRLLTSRMRHFPEHLYDLRTDSHLVRFCQALLGDSGAGQLRKRNLVTYFQTSLSSTHFYDLDGFYGAIFGLSRFSREALFLNPYTENATEQEWDSIAARDAAYRSRIARLASAINLGATLPGIKAAAEAICETEVDIYETWRLADTYATVDQNAYNDWDAIEAMGDWDDLEGDSWSLLADSFLIGRTGMNLRGEVVVRPRKDYDGLAVRLGTREAQRQRAEDAHSLVRVLSVLKPASVLLTVDMEGLTADVEIPASRLYSPLNYWSVSTRVTPNPGLGPGRDKFYPLSPGQAQQGLTSEQGRVMPKPPWSTNQHAEWSYAPEVSSVSAYSFEGEGVSEPGMGKFRSGANEEIVIYSDGTRENFVAQRSLMDGQKALAGRYSADGVLVAHPYSSIRVEAVLHG